MTAYASRTDLTNLGLPAAAITGISTTIQDAVLEACSRRVDSYLRVRYGVPFGTPYPQELVWAVAVLAAYDLMTTRGFNPDAGIDVTLRDRATDAITWCRDVAAGKVDLDPLMDATPTEQEAAPLMDYEDERGW